jgi:hypothetical protein
MKYIEIEGESKSSVDLINSAGCKPPKLSTMRGAIRNEVPARVCSRRLPSLSSAPMLIKSLQIGFAGLVLCAVNAWAGPASIQGVVKDAKGQPIKGADVRVESREGKQLFNTVKTDAKGRYISQGLQPGVYRVSLVVNGAVKAAVGNTKTKSDQATQLNFDLKPVAAGQASTEQKKGKHMVWVPPSTGSHMGGRWVEVPDGATEPGTLNVKRANAEQLQREAQSMGHGTGGQ